MKVTVRKLQKLFKSKASDHYITVEATDEPSIDNLDQAFSLNSPFLDNMQDSISLSLYHRSKQDDFLLSDDGFSYSNSCPDGIDDPFLKQYIEHTNNLSTATQLNESFDKQNQAFEIQFSDIKDLPDAYDTLLETIISFQAIADCHYQHEKYVKNQHHEDVYNNVQSERDNGLRLLDDIEGLIKIRATKAYIHSLKSQVESANNVLLALDKSGSTHNPMGINTKKLANRLNNDAHQYILQVHKEPELTNK